jgi:hypothetical protein
LRFHFLERDGLFKNDLTQAVALDELYIHPILRASLNSLPDEVRLDGEFAVTAVNEHGELNPARTAKVVQGVERRAGSAAAEQNVVHEHDVLAGDIERDRGRMHLGR